MINFGATGEAISQVDGDYQVEVILEVTVVSFFCVTEELSTYQYLMMKKREIRNSGKIVKKSIGNIECKLSCERKV